MNFLIMDIYEIIDIKIFGFKNKNEIFFLNKIKN